MQQIKARSLTDTPAGETLKLRLNRAIFDLSGMKVSFHRYVEMIGKWILNGGWEGPFFKVFLHHVYTELLEWFQPLLEQKTLSVEVNGEQIGLTGFVVGIRSMDGRTLLILMNEPGAPMMWNAKEKEIHPVLRHPIQVGAEKWLRVVELGLTNLDPVLGRLIETLGMGVLHTIKEWQISMHDPTRIIGLTGISAIILDDGQFNKLAEALQSLGGMVFTAEEIELLRQTGYLLTPHTKDGLSF